MDQFVDVASIRTHFETLEDPRHTRNRKHLLVEVIVICVAGILCGCDGPTAIHRWAAERQEWLRQYLTLANGIPSRDCLRRVLIALKPEAFQTCFRTWIAAVIAPVDPEAPPPPRKRLVAIDGKTCCGSHDAGKTVEVRYYLSTCYLSGKRFAEAVRGHWSIESMHWVLDVTFREDAHRTRERNLANNLSWLRRFAVARLKRHPVKDSIKGKMLRCAYNPDFLAEVLQIPAD